MKNVINEVFIDRNITMVYLISGVVMAIFLTKGLATYGQTVVLSRIGNSIIAKLQRDMFEKVTRLGVNYLTTQHLVIWRPDLVIIRGQPEGSWI